MKILVRYQNRPRSIAAITLAQQHAAKWQAEIHIVWAISRDKPLAQNRIQEMEEAFEEEVAQLFESSAIPYQLDLLIDTADAGKQILDFAEQVHADMIVLGLRKRSMAGKMIFGSNSQQIVSKAPCQVLTIRRD